MEAILKAENQEIKVSFSKEVTKERVIEALKAIDSSIEITEWVGPRPKK